MTEPLPRSHRDEALAALASAIASAKASDPLAPVTVVPPSNFAGLWLRRRLATDRGLVNVRFMSLARLAEFSGASSIPAPKERPRTPAVAAEAARHVLARDPGLFAAVASHPATAASLVAAFRELEDVTPEELATLERQGGRTAEIARLFRHFEAETGAYYSRPDLFRAASTVDPAGSGVFRDIGHVIVYQPGRLTPSQAGFVESLVLAGVARVVRPPATVAPVADRIVTVTDIDEEVRTVVSLILADLERGTLASQVACYFPVEAMYQPILLEQLTAAGIPFNAPTGVPLAATPPGRLLLGLLALEPASISRARLVDWIAAAPVRDGPRPVPVRTWSRISRDAGVSGGSPGRWAAGLSRYRDDQAHRLEQAQHDGRDGQAAAIERAMEAADWLGDFVADLSQRLQPPDANWRAWSAWAKDVLGRYLDHEELDRQRDGAAEIVEAVMASLDELAALDDLPAAVPVDRETFRQALEQALAAGTPPATHFGHGVFVAPIALAAGIGMESTYILGAVEGVLPAPVREDPLLPERARTAVTSLRGSRSRLDNLRASYLAAIAAARFATLSYPIGNLRRGREQLPSRWLLETASAHEGRRIDSREFARLRDRPWLLRSPSLSARLIDERLPLIDDSEYELAAMRLKGSTVARRPGVHAGIGTVRARNSASFTRFDGNLAGLMPAAVDGVVSPTRLETYARCPYRYFLGNVLRVAEFDEPEDVRALSALDRGTIIHDTLERFYGVTAGRAPGPWTAAERDQMTAIAREECDRFEQLGRTGGPALWNIERSRLLGELVDYLDADAVRSLAFGTRFHVAEVAFGEPGGWPAVEIPLSSGSLQFRGRIDRVDEGRNGEYWVYDYKTGSDYGLSHLADDPLSKGQRLQLPIYAEAVRANLGAENVRAGYWLVSDANGFGVRELPTGRETRFALISALEHMADGIGGGVFIANPGRNGDNCTYCPYAAICPNERSRYYDRKVDDPAVSPYAALVGDPS